MLQNIRTIMGAQMSDGTVCFIDLGKLNQLKISLARSKSVKQTVDHAIILFLGFWDESHKSSDGKFIILSNRLAVFENQLHRKYLR